MKKLTHLDDDGNARMVDVGAKAMTSRVAVASARVRLSNQLCELIAAKRVPKGDVLAVARVAGIMAAKKTPDLIPLCHTLLLDGVDVELSLAPGFVHVVATVKATGRTGVEMEALTAASVAALTLYDMCKALDRDLVIEQVQLEEKRGGKSGAYVRKTSKS